MKRLLKAFFAHELELLELEEELEELLDELDELQHCKSSAHIAEKLVNSTTY